MRSLRGLNTTSFTLSYTKDLNLWQWLRIVFNCIRCLSGLVRMNSRTLFTKSWRRMHRFHYKTVVQKLSEPARTIPAQCGQAVDS